MMILQVLKYVIAGLLVIGVLRTLYGGLGHPQMETQACTVMVRPGQSIQQTVEQAPPNAVICLTEGIFPLEAEPGVTYPPVVITKDLTLQGAGVAKTSITFGIDIGRGQVVLQDLSLRRGTLRVYEHAQVAVRRVNIHLFAEDTGTKESFFLGGILASGLLSLEKVQVISDRSSEVGLVFSSEDKKLEVIDSLFVGNGVGIRIRARDVKIQHSLIFNNSWQGIGFVAPWGGRFELIGVSVVGNGERCAQQVGIVCNGISIEVADTEPSSKAPQFILRDTKIWGNWEWGIAAGLEQCGYERDNFISGQVVFEGTNEIAANDRSGNHTAAGNPGQHPFTDLPPGNVCLP